MQTKKVNPFLVKGYIPPELFCDRENELEKLYQNAANGIDTTLISPRRLGKTGLIFRFFDFLSQKSEMQPIYVDIYSARSLDDLIKLLAEATLQKFPEKTSIGEKFFNLLKGLRPVITYDAISGAPQIQISYQTPTEKEYTLQGILQFLDSQNAKIVIAFDEFQQVAFFTEKNIEALLRTYIQRLTNIRFIFCGSRRDMMTEMFMNAKRPFFASTAPMSLEKIAQDIYRIFIKKLFAENGVKIEQNAVDFILDWTKCYTFYTQSLCNMTFRLAQNTVTLETVKTACMELLKDYEPTFYQYRNLLTSAQWNYLIAVAKEGEVSQIASKNFVNKYNIGSPSDSRRLLKALINKELILENITKTQTSYQIYDLFLSRWLEREY